MAPRMYLGWIWDVSGVLLLADTMSSDTIGQVVGGAINVGIAGGICWFLISKYLPGRDEQFTKVLTEIQDRHERLTTDQRNAFISEQQEMRREQQQMRQSFVETQRALSDTQKMITEGMREVVAEISKFHCHAEFNQNK